MGIEAMKFSVILTGATGMVGEGVLLASLEHPAIERVLSISRRSCGVRHPKLTECLVPDFLDLAAYTDRLAGYDACFYCAGVSSRGMSEADYSHITYGITMSFARVLAELNPQMTFCHISGSLADSSEKGRVMWARVKGRTENALMTLGFRKVYNFRPGFMQPTPGQRHVKSYYRIIGRLYPLLRVLFPNQVCTLREVGLAMIHSVLRGYPKQILEIKDIKALANA